MPTYLKDEEMARIKQAVTEAEKRTSGEIVPYIVGQSDSYEIAAWRGACIAAVLALFGAMLVFQFYTGWGLGWLHTGWGTALLTLGAGIVGALAAAFIRPVKLALAGPVMITERVHSRAMRAFVEEEVFNTRDRTGILIFISLFEHRIEVFGDAGINAKVTADDWAEIVEHIREGIRKGTVGDGIIRALDDCGPLLERTGVQIREDDPNELSNKVRMHRR